MISEHACVVVQCDNCGSQGPDDLNWHHPSLDEARQAFPDWQISDDGTAKCGLCIENEQIRAVCAAEGHRWEQLRDDAPRICTRCFNAIEGSA